MLSWRFGLCKCLVYVSYLTSLTHYIARRGESKIAAYNRSSNMQLPFVSGPILVSFNILSWTLSKTNDFTKHAHEPNHLKFYSVFNLSGQYQGRFWLVCSNAQSGLHLRWSPMIKNINEPVHEISNNAVCATSKASDQPAHTRSLIRAFASRLSILWLLSYWLNTIWSV